MYRVDKRIHRHKRARRNIIILIVLLAIAGLIWALFHLRVTPEQTIRNAPPVSTKYSPEGSKKIDIDKPEFTMQLAVGWEEKDVADGWKEPSYSFRSPSADARLLDIFLGEVPDRYALNRAIVVTAQGNGLAYDVVSSNCTTYTDDSKVDNTGRILAKWQGVDFYCDAANPARAVVGTISKEGINTVKVSGPETGAHSVFIVYTDNNITPDYTTLYSILGSLKFK